MSESPLDKMIKRSSEDTSGTEPSRKSPERLKTGDIYDKHRIQVADSHSPPVDWVACLVVDYMSFDERFDFNLVNFYYENEDDPRTVIRSFRSYADGRVETT